MQQRFCLVASSSQQPASCWQDCTFFFSSHSSTKAGRMSQHSHDSHRDECCCGNIGAQGLQTSDSTNLLQWTRPAARWHSAYRSKYCSGSRSSDLLVHGDVQASFISKMQQSHGGESLNVFWYKTVFFCLFFFCRNDAMNFSHTCLVLNRTLEQLSTLITMCCHFKAIILYYCTLLSCLFTVTQFFTWFESTSIIRLIVTQGRLIITNQ